jgi:hypothetical protein
LKTARSARVNSSVRCHFISSERFQWLTLSTKNRHIASAALIASGRLVTWITPVALWIVHVFVIVPRLNTESGEPQFITAIGFFMVAGPIMIVSFIVSVFVYLSRKSRGDLIPLLMNLSWLYYVKVIVYGPTIGNL